MLQDKEVPNDTLLIEPKTSRGFVQTAQVKEMTVRALNYIRAGFPVHLRGPTGTGKTTLALHIASKLKQPLILLHGDDQFTTQDLTGQSHGLDHKRMVDEFVRGVSKTEESITKKWMDHRLTVAVRFGYTLLYDEFTRSRPEANNILLSILQEGILDFPIQGGQGEHFVKVHPDFKIIFTSNPEEYAGVHKTQDALLDRMVTLDVENYDMETEVKITRVKSHLSQEEAESIVRVARHLRKESEYQNLPTIRGCIMVAKSVKKHPRAQVSHTSKMFRQICQDVFISELIRNKDRKIKDGLVKSLNYFVDQFCTDKKIIDMAQQDNEDKKEEKKEDFQDDVKPKHVLSKTSPIQEIISEATILGSRRVWSVRHHDWIEVE